MCAQSSDIGIDESIDYLSTIIEKEYGSHPSGSMKGYLIRDMGHCIVTKKEIKKICCIKGDCGMPEFRGSIICKEPQQRIWTLAAMWVAYVVQYQLVNRFKEYPFKKFSIETEYFWEYRYDENKLWKYRRTGYEIPFFKVNIEW